MADSIELEWLDTLPESWRVERLKGLFSFGKGLPITKENLTEQGVPVISYGQIHSKRTNGVEVQDHLLRYVPATYLKNNPQSLVKEGDFIFADTSEDLDGCGNCVYIDREMQLFAGYHTIIFQSKPKSNNKYLAYLFRTDAWRSQIRSRVSGVKLFSISRKILSNCTVILPPSETQTAIAAYLDDMVGQIDSVIAEAKASIDEYKSWKASIIYEAVTKGLDPNAEMKDSGVEWIGEIPITWELARIKNLADFMPKYDFSNVHPKAAITFTPMECIRTGVFENRSKIYSEINGSYTQYAEGDIVLAKVTPCFENGNICIMNGLHSGVGLGSSELFVLHPIKVNTRFLFYFLQHEGFKSAACATMTGTGGLKRVSSNFVQNAPIPLPAESTQQEIADYLDNKTSQIDSLISEKEALIADLESYKKSLIFEVVTGKRKVISASAAINADALNQAGTSPENTQPGQEGA